MLVAYEGCVGLQLLACHRLGVVLQAGLTPLLVVTPILTTIPSSDRKYLSVPLLSR